MSISEWRSVAAARPVRSVRPHELSAHLLAHGVEFRIVGSAAQGGVARDLDILLAGDGTGVDALEAALAEIGVGGWQRTLQLLRRTDTQFPLTIQTAHGRLDIHGVTP